MNIKNCDTFRVAASIGAEDLSAATLVQCAEAGIKTVELSYGRMWMCDNIPWDTFRKTAESR